MGRAAGGLHGLIPPVQHLPRCCIWQCLSLADGSRGTLAASIPAGESAWCWEGADGAARHKAPSGWAGGAGQHSEMLPIWHMWGFRPLPPAPQGQVSPGQPPDFAKNPGNFRMYVWLPSQRLR